MDFTSRMVELLGTIRREMNGETASSMRYYGKAYGLNYGVSLPTLRTMARAEKQDYEFAKYLYQQDIRELRLAALWIADADCLTVAEMPFWAAGIINSELAAEAAQALVSRCEPLSALFAAWTTEGQSPVIQYAALLGAARNPRITIEFLEPTAKVIRHNPDDRLTAQGAVALLAVLGEKKENRDAIFSTIGSLGSTPSADFIHEELTWRFEE
ncbi:MAG: DNA alkylation repair protein [Alistipes sp.]